LSKLDSTIPGQTPVADSCEHGNEPSGFKKWRAFLNQMMNYQIPQKRSAPQLVKRYRINAFLFKYKHQFVFKSHYKPPSHLSRSDFDAGGIPYTPTNICCSMDGGSPASPYQKDTACRFLTTSNLPIKYNSLRTCDRRTDRQAWPKSLTCHRCRENCCTHHGWVP